MPELGAEKVLKISVKTFLASYRIVVASYSRCPDHHSLTCKPCASTKARG